MSSPRRSQRLQVQPFHPIQFYHTHLTRKSSELSSVALGGRVISVSDDFFAGAFHLLLVEVS